MNWEPTSNAIVTFPDALRWVEPLLKAKPEDVIDHALNVEPAVLGIAADIARRTCDRLEKYGISEQHREYIFNQCTLAAAMAIELMRRGNAQLWHDMIEPHDEKE